MEKDKRPFYIWLIAILANVGVYLTLVLLQFTDDSLPSVLDALLLKDTYLKTRYLLPLGISLAVSVLPIGISTLNHTYKSLIAFGVMALFLVPIPFIILDANTCHESLCQMIVLLIPILIGLVVIFGIFYTIGIFFRKQSARFAISALWIESMIIAGVFLFVGYQIHLNTLVVSFEDMKPVEIAKVCDRFTDDSRGMDCWRKAIKAHPETNMCLLSKNTRPQFLCFNVLSNQSFSRCGGIETLGYERVTECWRGFAEKYPGVDFCQWEGTSSKKTCMDFFKTLSSQKIGGSNP